MGFEGARLHRLLKNSIHGLVLKGHDVTRADKAIEISLGL
jgi:hypothetical protein